MDEPLTADNLAEMREWVDARMAEPGFPPVAVEMAHALLAEVKRLRALLDRRDPLNDTVPPASSLRAMKDPYTRADLIGYSEHS